MPLRITPLLVGLLLTVACIPAYAQTDDDVWDELLQSLADEAVATGDDTDALEMQIDDLNDLREHPLDLNSATKQQLLRLPFIDDAQAEAILDYRTRRGQLLSVGELLLAEGIGQQEVKLLKLVSVVMPVTEAINKAKLKHEFTARLDVPLYSRAGWSWGRGIANRWRYVIDRGHWEAGLRGERDSGEPMFTRRIPLWDAMGGHVMLSDVGIVRNAVVGDFKVAFGEGLVVNQGFGFGKMLTHFWRMGASLRPHRSTDEFNFMRGGGAELDFGRGWRLTAFASVRKVDATINPDNSISSVNSSGLHRTEAELAHRRTVWSNTAGTDFGWQGRGIGVGLTVMYQHYDHALSRGNALYRQIYPQGYHFGNVGLHYAFRRSWLVVRGETARSFAAGGGGWATLNRAAVRFGPNTQLSAIQRFYSYHYYSPHARAYGDNSRVQNESGICLLAEAERAGPFSLSAYFDLFYSPWPRYTMTHASTGWEAMASVGFTQRQHRLLLRFRTKSKEHSDLRAQDYHLRATYSWRVAAEWNLQCMAFIHRHHTIVANSNGYAFMPRIDFSPKRQPVAASLSAVIFSTSDYDSRIAVYEPTLFRSFGLQQFYGRGQRVAATMRVKLGRHFALQAKLGVTHYSDRDVISSGITQISSPWKSDVQLLLRYH